MMIKKCLFPAAGYGTRFLPATKSMPKEMMPVVNKPLIEYGVDEAIQAGITGMCIVTGRGKHSIMDHFDMNYELEHQIRGTNKEELLGDIRKIIESANFTFIRQREMKGLGHAILTGKELVGDEPVCRCASGRPVCERRARRTGTDGCTVQTVPLLYRRCARGSRKRNSQIRRDRR